MTPDKERVRPIGTDSELATDQGSSSLTRVGGILIAGQPEHVVRWARGGVDFCLRCYGWGDLTNHPPCRPPTGLDDVWSHSAHGIRTYCTEEKPYGFTWIKPLFEFYGCWACDCSAQRSWDAHWFGPICTRCGEWGNQPGVAAPEPEPVHRLRPRPAGHVVTTEQIVKRLNGLRRYLRERQEPEPVARLEWVTTKVAEMLVFGDLPDFQAAMLTLRDDAEAAGVDRETAQDVIERAMSGQWVVDVA